MRVVKAAAVQLSSVLCSREGTLDKIARKIYEFWRQGVPFATFPETVVPYHQYFSFSQAPYQIIAGREHLRLLDQAVTVPAPDSLWRIRGFVTCPKMKRRDCLTL